MALYADYLTTLRAHAPAIGLAAWPTRERPAEGLFVVEAGGALELRYTERGGETTLGRGDGEDIARRVLASATGAQAQAEELRTRRRGEDSRRRWMLDHVRRLGALRPAWGVRQRQEYDAVLAVHPFDDALARRAERWAELMAQGVSRAEAVAQAEREHPPVPPTDADRRLPS